MPVLHSLYMNQYLAIFYNVKKYTENFGSCNFLTTFKGAQRRVHYIPDLVIFCLTNTLEKALNHVNCNFSLNFGQ
jgi:hypothetical protein